MKSSQNVVINDRRRDAERRHHRTPQLDTSKLRPRYLHYSKIIFLAARNPGILESWNPGTLGPHFSSWPGWPPLTCQVSVPVCRMDAVSFVQEVALVDPGWAAERIVPPRRYCRGEQL